MDLFAAVKKRRSIRKYKTDPIPDETLRRLLEAARWAPSWANVQAVRWIVVKSDALKNKLLKTLTPGNPSRSAIIRAPVVLGLCYVKGVSGFYKGEQITSIENWGLFDAGLAAANLTLAAAAEGLGTVHVGAINIEDAAQVLEVPPDVQLVEIIPIGIPADEGANSRRLDLGKIVFQETYGRQE